MYIVREDTLGSDERKMFLGVICSGPVPVHGAPEITAALLPRRRQLTLIKLQQRPRWSLHLLVYSKLRLIVRQTSFVQLFIFKNKYCIATLFRLANFAFGLFLNAIINWIEHDHAKTFGLSLRNGYCSYGVFKHETIGNAGKI